MLGSQMKVLFTTFREVPSFCVLNVEGVFSCPVFLNVSIFKLASVAASDFSKVPAFHLLQNSHK